MSLIEMRKDSHLRNGLIELANDVKKMLGNNINIIEIGSYAGESAEIFANIFTNSKIYCVDRWISYDCSADGVQPQIINLAEAELLFDNVCMKYNNIIKNKISSAGHDYKWVGVNQAISEILPKVDKTYQDHCWLYRKI